ncbi:MAG: hypothetical protein CL675_13790 [Bdellovibrionaceae bacterium]|nr:hypothetical protein [Pseudobdellovibrionaceae bacterium]
MKAGIALLAALGFTATVQAASFVNNKVDYGYQFAALKASGQAQVTQSHHVDVPADGVRLHFSKTDLPEGAALLIRHGKSQQLLRWTGEALKQFSYATPYLNAPVNIQVEVPAGQVFKGLRIVEMEYETLDTKDGLRSICGPTDERRPSNMKPFARMVRSTTGTAGCTATMIGPTCMVSAGHCTSTLAVAQFNVPGESDQGPRYSKPEDQYPLVEILDSQNGGQGRDWAVFRVNRNPITNKFPGELQGMVGLSIEAPGPGTQIAIVGYGSDDERSRNFTQQADTGEIVRVDGPTLRYVIDTMPGNSGSSVLDRATNKIIGIHTHGGCSRSGGSNAGTALAHVPRFQEAVQACLSQDIQLWNRIQGR